MTSKGIQTLQENANKKSPKRKTKGFKNHIGMY